MYCSEEFSNYDYIISEQKIRFSENKFSENKITECKIRLDWKIPNLEEDNTFEIGNICIKPEYQNKGIGTAVLKEIMFENKGKDIKLQAFKINEKAIKLYERIGFKKIEESKTHCIMLKNKN